MKKPYSKPQIKKEKFTPQEYCATCETPYSTGGGRAYYDLDRDGTCDSGESAIPTTGAYHNIKVYHLQKAKNYGQAQGGNFYPSNDTINPITNPPSYTEAYFSYNGDYYRFVNSDETVKIANGKVYKNVS